MTFSIIVLVSISCDNDMCCSEPGFSIYKTKADYFENASVTIFKDSSYRTMPTYNCNINNPSDLLIIYGNSYFGRVRLVDGYVLDYEAEYNDGIYLKVTLEEYRKIMSENMDSLYSKELILDADPYVEFYGDMGYPKYTIEDTVKINEYIRNGELGEYFEKFK